jgi:hydroxypyruvate isomerase
MAVFSLCIEMVCPPSDFYDRFKIAKESGFDWVEFWSWNDKDLKRITSLCKEHALSISSISGDNADFSLCDDSHLTGYIDYARASMEAAKELGCKTIVIHSNALGDGGKVVNAYSEWTDTRKMLNCVKTLNVLAPFAEKQGITCVLEPLNVSVDHAGNFLRTIAQTAEIVRAVNSPAIKILFDMYHMQIEQGNLLPTFLEYADLIAHIHIADNPGRHEPGTGEINYRYIIQGLDEAGYAGITAFELSPATTYEKAVETIRALR